MTDYSEVLEWAEEYCCDSCVDGGRRLTKAMRDLIARADAAEKLLGDFVGLGCPNDISLCPDNCDPFHTGNGIEGCPMPEAIKLLKGRQE